MTIEKSEGGALEAPEISDNEFELMFAQASAAPVKEEVKVEDPKPEVEKSTPKAEEAKVEDPKPKKAKGKEPEVKVEEVKAPEETEDQKAAKETAKKAKKDAADAAKAAEEAKTKQAKEEREKRAALTDDESALATEVAKDFPDLTKILEIKERILEAKHEARLEAFKEEMLKNLQPTMQAVSHVAADAFDREVAKTHADAQTLLPDVEKWIETQPKFLQDSYNKVLDFGTAAETVELLSLFKTATGRDKAADEDPAAAKAKAEKEKKLASQEGIRGRHVAQKDSAPSTFDDAFTQASKVV